MRIAYITYEYPPEIEKGGIATYTRQITSIMRNLGHQVFVFCATAGIDSKKEEDGIMVFRCHSNNPKEFTEAVVPYFSFEHEKQHFDLVEVPEIHANGAEVKKKFPNLPLVVRLHMANFIQQRLYRAYISRWTKFRYWLGSLRQGKWKTLGHYDYLLDPEYQFTILADGITSPSQAQKEIICHAWRIPEKKINVIPNPFEPGKEYLEIPVHKITGKQVCFIGKLNTHKGIVSLVHAIPLVLQDHPDAKFLLIGEDSVFFAKRMLMSEYISQTLGEDMRSVTILKGVPHDAIPGILAETAVCVFPSLWEAFGLVCLEAMSAGRMVIGSEIGGMAEILDENAGVLVDPLDVSGLARHISFALADEAMRFDFGANGRKKTLTSYRGSVVGPVMEKYYKNIIEFAGGKVG